MMMTITGLLRARATQHPGAPALIYEGETWDFASLEALGQRAAGGLAQLGVCAGDRVALWLPNTPAYLALWLGCAQLGAIAVAVNTRFRAVEVADIVHRSGARVPPGRYLVELHIAGDARQQRIRRAIPVVY